jgi:hypothetical protein
MKAKGFHCSIFMLIYTLQYMSNECEIQQAYAAHQLTDQLSKIVLTDREGVHNLLKSGPGNTILECLTLVSIKAFNNSLELIPSLRITCGSCCSAISTRI